MSYNKMWNSFLKMAAKAGYTAPMIEAARHFAEANQGRSYSSPERRQDAIAGWMRSQRWDERHQKAMMDWDAAIVAGGIDDSTFDPLPAPAQQEASASRVPPAPPPPTAAQDWARQTKNAMGASREAYEQYFKNANDPAIDTQMRATWQAAASDTAAATEQAAPAAPAAPAGGGDE